MQLFAAFVWSDGTFCGDRRSRCAKARVSCNFYLGRTEPSAGIGVTDVQKLRAFSTVLSRMRQTICANTEGFCDLFFGSVNPVQGSCVTKRSRCGSARVCKVLNETFARIVRVTARSLRRRANSQRALLRLQLATSKHESSTHSQLVVA